MLFRSMVWALSALTSRCTGSILFTFAPYTPLLGAMHTVGKVFPRSDRSPRIVPHATASLYKCIARDEELAEAGVAQAGHIGPRVVFSGVGVARGGREVRLREVACAVPQGALVGGEVGGGLDDVDELGADGANGQLGGGEILQELGEAEGGEGRRAAEDQHG